MSTIKTETHHSRITCCHDQSENAYWLGSSDFNARDRAMNALMPMEDFIRESCNGFVFNVGAHENLLNVANACFNGTRPTVVPQSAAEKAKFRAIWDCAAKMKPRASFVGGIAFHVSCPVAGTVDFLYEDEDGLHVCLWCDENSSADISAFHLSTLRLMLELSKQFEKPFGESFALVASLSGVVRVIVKDRRLDAAVAMFQITDGTWFRKNEIAKPL